ncbi:alpha/beta hydrolase [Chthonobacter rhizosphaerae]|uniref:alpha/beta hydrolase n=1 Tax=Chthonobacter rhizosphaerae TaxID=2735553 RepID=UPI0015EE7925|nr:alpha/beta hydrolase family protein [Chthonobacter rhizosphaerae]
MRHLLLSIALLVAGTSAASAGVVEFKAFDSPALGRTLPTAVYVPEGAPPVGGWPVVYLLHGHNGNERSWVDLGAIEETLDRLMAKGGDLDPALVVMPDAENSWYVDSEAAGGPGDYETALTRDLRKAVEAAYPVRTDRTGRAVVGLSMGGFGALRLGLTHPDLYAVSASLSGAIWQNIPQALAGRSLDDLKAVQNETYLNRLDEATMTAGVILPSVGDHYEGAFGTPFDAGRFNALNVFTLLAKQVAASARLPAFYIACGDDDGHGLWRGAVAFYTALKANGEQAELRIADGDHIWPVWARDVVGALAYVEEQREAGDAVVTAPVPADDRPAATPAAAVLALDEKAPVVAR